MIQPPNPRRGVALGLSALTVLAAAAAGVVAVVDRVDATAQQPAVALVTGGAAFDISPALVTEVTAMNDLFQLEASVAGVPATDINLGTPSLADPLSFDTIDKADVNNVFATLLYGLNPANAVDDPGSYSLFNGATTEFTNAFNVALYAAMDGGNLIGADDLFGSPTVIGDALATDSATGAFGVFFDAGVQDMFGYLLPAL